MAQLLKFDVVLLQSLDCLRISRNVLLLGRSDFFNDDQQQKGLPNLFVFG